MGWNHHPVIFEVPTVWFHHTFSCGRIPSLKLAVRSSKPSQKETRKSSNHPFLGVNSLLVSGRVVLFVCFVCWRLTIDSTCFRKGRCWSCHPQKAWPYQWHTPLKLLVLRLPCCHVAMSPRHWGAQFQAMQVEGEPQYMAGVGTEVQAAPQVGWCGWCGWLESELSCVNKSCGALKLPSLWFLWKSLGVF